SGKRHGMSDHRGIAAISALEILIAQNCVHRQPWGRRSSLLLGARRRRGRIGDCVVFIEVATVRYASAEQTEEVGGHYRGVGLLWAAILVLQRERKSENTGKIIED